MALSGHRETAMAKPSEVFEIRFPTALMPRADVGQLNFETDDKSLSFLMPRADFERLGRKIARLLDAIPAPAPKRAAKRPNNEK
jgi:hypothetical protein